MGNIKKHLDRDGYVIFKKFFDREYLIKLKIEAEDIFDIQAKHHGYVDHTIKEQLIKLFKNHPEIFKNCGKLIQTGLLPLYDLAIHHNIIWHLKKLGLEFPVMCTRPVLFLNHPKLAESPEYYKTPQHMDWPSIQSSNNSVVVWVPLVDVNKENGSLILYPGTHKQEHEYTIEGGFAKTNYKGESIQPELKVGDIIIFNTKLIHESGEIFDDSIRWSASFRYTDMLSQEFIEKGFPNPYKYVPITKQ